MSNYNLQYFKDKFNTIPEELFYDGEFVNKSNPDSKCYLGHCGCTNEMLNFKNPFPEEALALRKLVKESLDGLYITHVNQGNAGIEYNYLLLNNENPRGKHQLNTKDRLLKVFAMMEGTEALEAFTTETLKKF